MSPDAPETGPPTEHAVTDSPADDLTWTVYGQRQLDRGWTPPVPSRIDWGFWPGVGPGTEVLGDLAGRRVLDIGSGPGHHAVHLARDHGALVDGVDFSPTQHQRAVGAFGDEPGVRFLCADVIEHLDQAPPYEAAYGLRSLACIDPERLLPALRGGLLPDAPLVFSALHTNSDGHGPSTTVSARQEEIRLKDTEPIPSTT